LKKLFSFRKRHFCFGNTSWSKSKKISRWWNGCRFVDLT